MQIKASEISQIIKDQIAGYESDVDLKETGTILSVGDGIARVYGVENCQAMELLEFPGGIMGLALNLEEDNVGVAVMGDVRYLKEGDIVKRTGKIAEVPVGPALEGRVVDGIGQPIDGKGPIEGAETRKMEVLAPGVIARKSVHEPCYTGYKAVDGMTPVGRGQRELIIGDRQIGKTALCVDAIIAQKDGVLHFIEVKSSGRAFDPVYNLTPKKLQRVINSAHYYLKVKKLDLPFCIDALLIRRGEVELIENITL